MAYRYSCHIRETVGPFNRHKMKLNAISSQDAPVARYRSKRSAGVRRGRLRRRQRREEVRGGVSQAARQLRHNSPRTYNQTIAIIINRYTFNDRVCRTRPDVGFILRTQAIQDFVSSKFSCHIRSSEARLFR